MKLPLALLGIAWLGSARAEEPASAWKIDARPALVPGLIGEWDDFAISSASVARAGDRWTMLYEGVGLSEDGKTHAFGVAESSDGIKWSKIADSIFAPADHEWEVVMSPSITRWRDGWLALYLVSRSMAFQEKAVEDFGLPQHWLCLAWSGDGQQWEFLRKVQGISFPPTQAAPPRPCLYADENTLHAWWVGETNDETPALFHSVSRDGLNWSKPSHQATSEIDPRTMRCAQVQPSGDYYILTYVAVDSAGARLVTKVSQNARTWRHEGPPELAMPKCYETAVGWQQAAPSVVFSKQGARVFFVDLLFAKASGGDDPRSCATQGAVLRTAFWPKPQ